MFFPKIIGVASRCFTSVPKRVISLSVANSAKHPGIIRIQNYVEFKEMCIDNELPVIVDVFAEWCAPCKELSRRFDSVMGKFEDKVCLAIVDIDKVDELISEYEIVATPTVIGLKNGKEVSRFTGLKENEALEKFIKEHITETQD